RETPEPAIASPVAPEIAQTTQPGEKPHGSGRRGRRGGRRRRPSESSGQARRTVGADQPGTPQESSLSEQQRGPESSVSSEGQGTPNAEHSYHRPRIEQIERPFEAISAAPMRSTEPQKFEPTPPAPAEHRITEQPVAPVRELQQVETYRPTEPVRPEEPRQNVAGPESKSE
ncbi:MAG: hypothetical protein ABIN45_02100, partial [Gammaproteobacteria bacterium]